MILLQNAKTASNGKKKSGKDISYLEQPKQLFAQSNVEAAKIFTCFTLTDCLITEMSLKEHARNFG